MTDVYSLGQALKVFARPEDEAAEEEFLEKWCKREAEIKLKSKEIENELNPQINRATLEERYDDVSRLKQELDNRRHALGKALIAEFGGVIPRERGTATSHPPFPWEVPIATNFSSLHPFTHGLLSALREGDAVAHGRQGGLQYPKGLIEPKIWKGDWKFRGKLAEGGVPFVEIHDISVSRRDSCAKDHAVERKASLPAAKSLAPPDKQKIRAFLKEHGPSSEHEAWPAAEKHLGRKITRDQFRKVRKEIGVSVTAKGGRPRKSR